MFCAPTGAPRPTIKWRRKNDTSENLLKNDRVNISPTGKIISTLRIEKVQAADAGEYVCDVSNKDGSAEASGRLIVKGKGYGNSFYWIIFPVDTESELSASKLFS